MSLRAVAALLLALAGGPPGDATVAPTIGSAEPIAAGARAPAQDTAVAGRDVPGDTLLEARASRVAAELRCPVCQGLSIEDSPSPLALQMKQLIRDQLAAGRSEEEVKEYFTGRYGEWVLLEPEPTGFNLLVYVLPVVALLAGVAVVVLAVRRWTRPAEGSAR